MNKQEVLAGTAVVFLLLFCMACGNPASDKQVLRDIGREKVLCETDWKSGSTLSEAMAEVIKTAGGDQKTPEEEESEGRHYTLISEITVDNGRKLDLILHGFHPAERYGTYGIDKIDVYDGTELIQTIFVKEAIQEEGTDYGYMKGYTETWDENEGLDIGDMNFDGAEDIGLFAWITTGANIPYYYWLWDKEEQQFTYAFCICTPSLIDTEKEQIVVEIRDGSCWITEYYAYDENGELQLVGYIHDDYNDDVLKREVYELIDGEMQLIGEEPLPPQAG